MTILLVSDINFDAEAVVAKYPWPFVSAILDFDYANERFYYNGTVYDALADMVTAGFYTENPSGDSITLPSSITTCSLFFEGVAAGTTPSGAAQWALSLDDGEDGDLLDNAIWIDRTQVSPAGRGEIGCYRGGAIQTGDEMRSLAVLPNSTHVSVAARFATSNLGVSYNGAAVRTNGTALLPTSLTRVTVKNRGIDYARPWGGTATRVAVIAAAVTDAELIAMATP
ncbi:hypothetical protein J2X65_001642 [Ancylobacter sp. 3268]|uniref:hypothetical protein n=1 Tax=Ancylobacter sp. 3268 TaxID=2817752 RepID=UPI002863EE7B|nr:hypothetical protein [Ancylobacter sp. 3268]MDR6952287.1 hypothetical protein [Ancylobacter sp. 3268]